MVGEANTCIVKWSSETELHHLIFFFLVICFAGMDLGTYLGGGRDNDCGFVTA